MRALSWDFLSSIGCGHLCSASSIPRRMFKCATQVPHLHRERLHTSRTERSGRLAPVDTVYVAQRKTARSQLSQSPNRDPLTCQTWSSVDRSALHGSHRRAQQPYRALRMATKLCQTTQARPIHPHSKPLRHSHTLSLSLSLWGERTNKSRRCAAPMRNVHIESGTPWGLCLGFPYIYDTAKMFSKIKKTHMKLL